MHWRLERAIQNVGRLGSRWRRARWNLRARKFSRDENGLVKLHIGCGEIAADHFVNVDARPYPHVHIVTRNLLDLSMIPDRVASLVYMSHVLEHVPHAKVNAVLRDMKRVLAPNGVIRLSVPDFDRVIDIYQAMGKRAECIVGPLMGGQDYAFNFHYTIFTRESLTEALVQAGFREVRAWDASQCPDHDFEDWSGRLVEIEGRSFPISLNLEAEATHFAAESARRRHA